MMFDDILERMALGALGLAFLIAAVALGFGAYFFWKWMKDE